MRSTASFAFVSFLAACAGDGTPISSEQQACQVLQRAAIEWCLSRTNLEGRYWCDASPESPENYVLALRYYPEPQELVGSTLIGWYAVSKSDGSVFNYDITNEELTGLTSGCPFDAE
jgi:hypothetical protein